MQSQAFAQYLISHASNAGAKRTMSPESAHDAVSRCSRVEKHLSVDLDSLYARDALDGLIGNLAADWAKFGFAGATAPGLRDMLTALRHYKAYLDDRSSTSD